MRSRRGKRQGLLVVQLWPKRIATLLQRGTQGDRIRPDEIHGRREQDSLFLRLQTDTERAILRRHAPIAVGRQAHSRLATPPADSRRRRILSSRMTGHQHKGRWPWRPINASFAGGFTTKPRDAQRKASRRARAGRMSRTIGPAPSAAPARAISKWPPCPRTRNLPPPRPAPTRRRLWSSSAADSPPIRWRANTARSTPSRR